MAKAKKATTRTTGEAAGDGDAIDCRDANGATEEYRRRRDAGARVIEFVHVWATHPTWQTAIADGIWVAETPPDGPPGGSCYLARIA